MGVNGAIVAAVAAAAMTGLGVWSARRKHELVQRLTPVVVAFAAGVLITAALTHLLPHSLRVIERAPLYALGGFVAMVLLDRVASGKVCGEDEESCEPAGWLALFGIGLHSFLDGLTYTVTFAAGGISGATVALGMILHELPEGLIAYAMLVRGGSSPKRATRIGWLVAGLTTPLGACIAVPLIDVLDSGVRAVLVAIAGGVLLHVGAAHLLPQVMRRRPRGSVLAFVCGVALALAGTLVH